MSIISLLFNANGERTPYKSIYSVEKEKLGETFCFVLLNEEIALLKLVTLRSEESSPSSVAAIFAISSSGSGRHLGANRTRYTFERRKESRGSTLCLPHDDR